MLTLRLYKYTEVEPPVAWPANKVVTTQNWEDFAVPFVAGTGKSAGQHTASVDPTISLQWIVFPSATEPDDLNDSLTGVLFDLSTEIASLLLMGDPMIEEEDGVQVMKFYLRGTSTLIIPAKAVLQPGGAALTNPATQRIAGYRE